MIIVVLILIGVCTMLPLWFAWTIVRLDEPTPSGWLAAMLEKLTFVMLVMLVGRWDIAGTWTRTALLVVTVTAACISWWRHVNRPWRGPSRDIRARDRAVRFGTLAIYLAAAGYLLVTMVPSAEIHDIALPLDDGRFVVAQGGGNALLNHHNGHRAQHHAVDITAVNAAGFRAAGILPADPRDYAIYGADVVSPCDGTVLQVEDTHADLSPPNRDRDNPAGNRIVIDCDGLEVEMAHLRQHSIRVSAADTVVLGQALAEVDNSGNTSEPHLHVHATDPRTGAGIALTFDGDYPVRNRVYRR